MTHILDDTFETGDLVDKIEFVQGAEIKRVDVDSASTKSLGAQWW